MDTSTVLLPAPSKAEKIYEATHEHRGFPIRELRETFAAVVDPQNIRSPWRREVPKADVDRIKAAVHYFSADEAYVAADHGEKVEMAGNGLKRWSGKSV